MKNDLYAEVSARIIAELEAGAAPWVKQWSASASGAMPCNAATNRPYSGVNIILLWMATEAAGWGAMRFLTYKQAQELGGNVRKGEKGSRIFFVKRLDVRDTSEPSGSDEATRTITMMRAYTVFNVAQCDGLPARVVAPGEAKPPRNNDVRDVLADEFVAATGATLQEGAGRAAYIPSLDRVQMPAFRDYNGAAHFYCDLFHELGHWTGAKPRLDRDLSARFDKRAYAAEELIAELCAAFLCAEFGFDGELRHAGYIASWIELLKADARAFFTAASKAQQAADYLRGLALAEPIAEAA